MVCKWQVEIDEYCSQVLERNWPDVPRWGDVRTFPPAAYTYSDAMNLAARQSKIFWPDHESFEGWRVDLICGGFPCQDISAAGKREGIGGQRSGLYTEILRVVSVLRPRILLLENVAALLFNGMDVVCGDLATLGFCIEWATLPASRFGAPHQRDRVFILAYRSSKRRVSPRYFTTSFLESIGAKQTLRSRSWPGQREHCELVPDRVRWMPTPRVRRVVDGLPTGMDRNRARGLGNAVVPQVAESIGRRIVEVEKSRSGKDE